MQQSRDIRFDAASAISQGRRPYQEDAIVTDFPLGADIGFVVLADGMGGHAAGDVASKIVVTEVYSELKLQSGNTEEFKGNLPRILRDAAMAANDCMKVHIQAHQETAGMGSTLIAPVFVEDSMYWISIGDSPLFLYRDGDLRQVNEDHSMAPQIDFMIRSGMMAEEIGRNHPDRSCLTSVLGGDPVMRIDCPDEPLKLCDGDILIAASDGLQYLSDREISEILTSHRDRPSAGIADALLSELEAQQDPEQDNASFSVIKISLTENQGRRKAGRKARDRARDDLEPVSDIAASSSGSFKTGAFFRRSSFFRSSAQ